MKVLIACEFSGIVREAFARRGHDAWSCDLLPTEQDGNHIQGDVLQILNDGWDMAIFHPECTYLANSGVRWLHERPERWELLREAAKFFNDCLNAPIPMICVENPIQHKYARELIRIYDQIIQPHYFGDKESKATCLWLVGLPELIRTHYIPKEEIKQSVWREAPSPERKENRSRFWQGIAQAMANQWSYLTP